MGKLWGVLVVLDSGTWWTLFVMLVVGVLALIVTAAAMGIAQAARSQLERFIFRRLSDATFVVGIALSIVSLLLLMARFLAWLFGLFV